MPSSPPSTLGPDEAFKKVLDTGLIGVAALVVIMWVCVEVLLGRPRHTSR